MRGLTTSQHSGPAGGFQHMAIEFARNVLGIADAEHAEYDPYASKLVVNAPELFTCWKKAGN